LVKHDIRLEMLKALNSEGILWLTWVYQVVWSLAKHRNNGRQAWSSRYSRKVIKSNAQTTEEYHCLVARKRVCQMPWKENAVT